jgi:hypothetical protein
MTTSVCKARIARALAELEEALQCEVEDVVLTDVDVTQVKDEVRQYVRMIELRLRPMRRYSWGTFPDLPGV